MNTAKNPTPRRNTGGALTEVTPRTPTPPRDPRALRPTINSRPVPTLAR